MVRMAGGKWKERCKREKSEATLAEEERERQRRLHEKKLQRLKEKRLAEMKERKRQRKEELMHQLQEQLASRKTLDFMISASAGANKGRYFTAWRDHQLEAKIKRVKEQRSISWLQSCGAEAASGGCGAAGRLRDFRYAMPFELSGGSYGDSGRCATLGFLDSYTGTSKSSDPRRTSALEQRADDTWRPGVDETWRPSSSLVASGSPAAWMRQSPGSTSGGAARGRLEPLQKLQNSSSAPALHTSEIWPTSGSAARRAQIPEGPQAANDSDWGRSLSRGPPPPDNPAATDTEWGEVSHWSTGWQCWMGAKTGRLRLWEENSCNPRARPFGQPYGIGYSKAATSLFMTGEPITTLV